MSQAERYNWAKTQEALNRARKLAEAGRASRWRNIAMIAGTTILAGSLSLAVGFSVYNGIANPTPDYAGAVTAKCKTTPSGYEVDIFAHTSKLNVGKDGITVIVYDPAKAYQGNPRHSVINEFFHQDDSQPDRQIGHFTQNEVSSVLDIDIYKGGISAVTAIYGGSPVYPSQIRANSFTPDGLCLQPRLY